MALKRGMISQGSVHRAASIKGTGTFATQKSQSPVGLLGDWLLFIRVAGKKCLSSITASAFQGTGTFAAQKSQSLVVMGWKSQSPVVGVKSLSLVGLLGDWLLFIRVAGKKCLSCCVYVRGL